MIETLSALTCLIGGVDPININQGCLGADQKTGKIGYVQNGGAISAMGGMIGSLYSPPIHGVDYFKNLASNFGISKQAMAQTTGNGFDSLHPLIGLWTTFRNIVYLLFVVVFVSIGIAIMLRVKIDPRTVMTIQNQIPKIIVGLILVTFSFAIAGFLIDIMYVYIYLLFNVFKANIPNLVQSPFGFANAILGTGGILNIVTGSSFEVGKIVAGLVNGILGTTVGQAINLLFAVVTFVPKIACKAVSLVPNLSNVVPVLKDIPVPIPFINLGGGGSSICNSVDNLPQYFIGGIAGVIAFLVILIAILLALFRLWFALLSAYIFLLLDVVFAPFLDFCRTYSGKPRNFWAMDKRHCFKHCRLSNSHHYVSLGKILYGQLCRKRRNRFYSSSYWQSGRRQSRYCAIHWAWNDIVDSKRGEHDKGCS